MDSDEIINFCLRNGLLIEKDVLEMFTEESGKESVKLIIEKIKNKTNRKVITKDFFYDKDKAFAFFSSFPTEEQKKLEKIKVKLGLSIEISKGVSEKVVEKKSEVRIVDSYSPEGKKFEVGDFVKYFRNRFVEMKEILQTSPVLENLTSINKASSDSVISVIGMVGKKSITKNKNIILEVEDLTGTAKIIVSKNKPELLEKAENISLDSVLGFKCSGGKDILFAREIIFPDSKLYERKKSPVEEYALFIGDVHFGSKNFMGKNFKKFIDYLNGKFSGSEEIEKIKYLFILGDLITGVGVYPDQERDLVISNLEDQYIGIAEILGKIRKDIKIIIAPGNHEGVRLMEPQPIYDEKYAWALHDLENVVLVGNPSIVNVGSKQGFSGFDVLIYHGFSYPFYADNVPKLMKIKAMNSPEKIMTYLLEQRHLAPTHGSVQYFPSEKDFHLIRKTPDIFASGHTHKGAVVYHNNILVVSCATWESLTPYQEKFGNTPDFCKVPMMNLKTRAIKILDFE